jgi:hypothetical protein
MKVPVRPRNSIESTSSALQDHYQKFFMQKLSKYGADSPASLDKDKLSDLFEEIKKEWPAERASFEKNQSV